MLKRSSSRVPFCVTTEITYRSPLSHELLANRDGSHLQYSGWVRCDPRCLKWWRRALAGYQAIAVEGFGRLNVMRTYPDSLFASNAAGLPLSRFDASSHTLSVSLSRA